MSLVKKLGIGIITSSLLAGCDIKIENPNFTYSEPIVIDAQVLQKSKSNQHDTETKMIYSIMMKNPFPLIKDDEINYIEFGNEKIKVGIDDKNIYNSYQIGQNVRLTYREIYNKEKQNYSYQFILAQKK